MKRTMAEEIVTVLGPLVTNYERAVDKLMKAYVHDAYICWSTDDILDQAQQDGKKISDREAQELLHKIIDDHDSSVGVSWDTISDYLSDFPDSPEEPKAVSLSSKHSYVDWNKVEDRRIEKSLAEHFPELVGAHTSKGEDEQ